MIKRHKNEIQGLQGRPHQILIVEKNHTEEMKVCLIFLNIFFELNQFLIAKIFKRKFSEELNFVKHDG